MKRCTLNLPDTSKEASLLAELLDSSTGAHQALALLAPDLPLNSESAVLRALVHVAGRAIEQQALYEQYERAIDAGEFDKESEAWHRAARRTTKRMSAEP